MPTSRRSRESPCSAAGTVAIVAISFCARHARRCCRAASSSSPPASFKAVIYFAEASLDGRFPRAVFGIADNCRLGLWINYPSPRARPIFLDIILDVAVLHGLLDPRTLVRGLCRMSGNAISFPRNQHAFSTFCLEFIPSRETRLWRPLLIIAERPFRSSAAIK